MPLPELFVAGHLPPDGSRVVVGLSGGLDSTVLLHALVALGRHDVRAVHVHHGLQPVADDWATHCERLCRRWQVPLQVLQVRVGDAGQGPEAAARDARYAALMSAMRPGDVLATAHHLDDQAETVLLRLLRGSGPRGLGGMSVTRGFGPGTLWRPLLGTPREQVRQYARRLRLRWIEDPHNADARFARSRLRREVMPMLAQFPGATNNIARAGQLAREAAGLLDALADRDLQDVGAEGPSPPPVAGGSHRPAPVDGARVPAALCVTALRALDDARRRNVLRRWIERQGLPSPHWDTLMRVEDEMLRARVDAEPVLAWPGAELRRYRDALVAMAPLPEAPQGFSTSWDGEGRCRLPDGCGGLGGSRLGPCVVHVPVPVSRFRPAGATHHRTLKNLWQERGVAPWIRVRTPAVARDGRIVWIGGIGWAEGEEPGSIQWSADPPSRP